MSKELNQIQPLAQDEIEAWGDVPPLTGHTLFAEAATEKQRADTLEAELAQVKAELDSETKWANDYHDAWIKARDKLVQLDSAMSCGHARRYIYSANERAEITTSTCMMCALQSASARIAELEAERDAANKRAEFVDAATYAHEVELHQAAMRRIAELERERDAANKRAKEYVGVFKRVNAAKRVWRKRAEQAEAELGAAINQRNIAQRFVNENADLIEYWRDLFKRANAEKRAYRRERNLAIATGTTLLQQRDRARDALREWQEGREVNALADYADTEIRKRAEQAEEDARALASLCDRYHVIDLIGNEEGAGMWSAFIAKYLDGAK